VFDCNLTDLHLHSVTVQLHLIGIRKNIVSECSGKSEVVVTAHCVFVFHSNLVYIWILIFTRI